VFGHQGLNRFEVIYIYISVAAADAINPEPTGSCRPFPDGFYLTSGHGGNIIPDMGEAQ
jgi:hypothetical protein